MWLNAVGRVLFLLLLFGLKVCMEFFSMPNKFHNLRVSEVLSRLHHLHTNNSWLLLGIKVDHGENKMFSDNFGVVLVVSVMRAFRSVTLCLMVPNPSTHLHLHLSVSLSFCVLSYDVASSICLSLSVHLTTFNNRISKLLYVKSL